MSTYRVEFIDTSDYLEHHGIKGQRWGIRRSRRELGYDDPVRIQRKKAKILKKARKAKIRKAKATEKANTKMAKRRLKIMSNPKLLKKHISELSDEDINRALINIRNKQQVDDLIKKEKPVKLTGAKKKWAKDPKKLQKHASQFTDAEWDAAVNNLNREGQAWDARMDKANRAAQMINVGASFVQSIANVTGSGYNLYNNINNIRNIVRNNKEHAVDRRNTLRREEEVHKSVIRKNTSEALIKETEAEGKIISNEFNKAKNKLALEKQEWGNKKDYKEYEDEAQVRAEKIKADIIDNQERAKQKLTATQRGIKELAKMDSENRKLESDIKRQDADTAYRNQETDNLRKMHRSETTRLNKESSARVARDTAFASLLNSKANYYNTSSSATEKMFDSLFSGNTKANTAAANCGHAFTQELNLVQPVGNIMPYHTPSLEEIKKMSNIYHSDSFSEELYSTSMSEVMDYLEHHGVAGQKWGLRNGPPYPLTTQNGGPYDLQFKDVNLQPDGKWKNAARVIAESKKNPYPRDYPGAAKKGELNEEDLRRCNSDPVISVINKHHKLKGTAQITAGVLLFIFDPVDCINLIKRGSWNIKHKTYLQYNPGVHNNCVKCGFTMELRKRGYDVSAGKCQSGWGISTYSNFFKPPFDNKLTTLEGQKQVANKLHKDYFFGDERMGDEKYTSENVRADAIKFFDKAEPGDSGVYANSYGWGRGGHMIHWEKSKDGSLIFRDGQNAMQYNGYQEMIDAYGFKSNYEEIYKLSDKEPNWDRLEQISVIREATKDSKTLNVRTNKIMDREVFTGETSTGQKVEVKVNNGLKHSSITQSEKELYSSEMMDLGRNFLEHHGIKGQRWGVKNGPPYPLDSSQKTTKEKNYSATTKTKKETSNAPLEWLEQNGFEKKTVIYSTINKKKPLSVSYYEKKIDKKDEYGQTRKYTFHVSDDSDINKDLLFDDRFKNVLEDIVNNPQKIDKQIRTYISNDENFINDIWDDEIAALPEKDKKAYIKRYLGHYGDANEDPNEKMIFNVTCVLHLTNDGKELAEIAYDDAGLFYGHTVIQEYDINNKRPIRSPYIAG